jgi:hypothetical protein
MSHYPDLPFDIFNSELQLFGTGINSNISSASADLEACIIVLFDNQLCVVQLFC